MISRLGSPVLLGLALAAHACGAGERFKGECEAGTVLEGDNCIKVGPAGAAAGGTAGGAAGIAGAQTAGGGQAAGAQAGAGLGGSGGTAGGAPGGAGGAGAGSAGTQGGASGATGGASGTGAGGASGTGGAGASGTGGAKGGTGGAGGGAGGTAGTAGTAGAAGGAAGVGGAGAGGASGFAGASGKAGATGIVCGNGIAEFGEQCDGDDLKGKTCEQAFPNTKGYLACSPKCEFVPTQCSPVPYCGDGKVTGAEQCDGDNLNGKSCADVLGAPFAKGLLSCNFLCELESGGCYVPDHCGDGKVNLPEEECDGAIPQGASCRDLLGSNYSAAESPACTVGCKVSYAPCKPIDGHDGPPTVYVQMGLPGSTVTGGIQATEVTRAQYARFVEATGGTPPPGQIAECAENQSVVPAASCMSKPEVCKQSATECARHPQVCVDWCDAAAFCSWAGKRICSGPGGVSIPSTAWADPSQDVWYAACTSNGKYDFAYGSSFVPGACNTKESGLGSTVEVGSLPGCTSPDPDFAGIFDLFGNVAEWEDTCHANNLGQRACSTRGEGFWAPALAGCASPKASIEGYTDIGFRCCD